MAFNYLTGSTIDNSKKLLFDAFESGNCYLGFARSVPEVQWGINALVYIQHAIIDGSTAFPTLNIAGSGDTYSSNKFFDLNSLSIVEGSTDGNRTIYIAKVANTDTSVSYPQYLPLGDLKLNYLGEEFCVIEGLPYDYYNLITYSTSASYYIINAEYNTALPIKILNKTYGSIPSYTSPCFLAMDIHDGSGFNTITTNLERSINALGEIAVHGMQISNMTDSYIFNDSVSARQHKSLLVGATDVDAISFRLIDTNGNIIQDNLTYDNIDAGNLNTIWIEDNKSKFIPLKYPLYSNGEVVYQRLNLNSGTKQNEVGIWNEKLPYDTINLTSDTNPPAQDITYTRNLSINKSIFDVKGLSKIIPETDVLFVKQMTNDSETSYYSGLGFTIENIELNENSVVHSGTLNTDTVISGDSTVISLNNGATFLVGDNISIPYDASNPTGAKRLYQVIAVDKTLGSNSITVYPSIPNIIPSGFELTSSPTNTEAILTLAETTDKNKAVKQGFTSIMISKNVPISGSSCPTEDIYRQLFICYKPTDTNGNLITDSVFQGSNFNPATWEYGIGNIFYLANKIPIYRKYASQDENFKIII